MKNESQIAAERAALLQVPHNIMLVDQVIDVKAGAFSSTITLGYETPTGQIQVAVTLQLPTNFLKTLSDQILEKLKVNATLIKEEHAKLSNSI